MNLNPEFQRQLYLEFSQARLIGVPLVLAIVFALTYVIDDYQFADSTARTALALFLIMVSFWGARQAVDSVLDEQRSHTWDTQRLSALDPWSMVFGKLFGSTLVVWYSGAICLVVYALAQHSIHNFFWVSCFAISTGLLIQSLSLLLSLLATRKEQITSNSMIIGLAVLAAFTAASWIMPLSDEPESAATALTASWYGFNSTARFLTLITICWALFWCVVGSYRLMAQELRIRTTPWVWLAFVLFLIVYSGGFIDAEHRSEGFYTLAFGICLTLTYLAVFAEPQDAMRVKRLLTYFSQENWQRSAEELPLWFISFGLAVVMALPLAVTHPEDIEDLHIYPLSMLLLLLRDIAIFLYFSYGKNPQRAFSLMLLAMVLLYGMLPGLFMSAKLEWLAMFFLPLLAPNTMLALTFSLIQSGLFIALLYRRWQESV